MSEKYSVTDWTTVEVLGPAKVDSPLLDTYLKSGEEPECSGVFVEDSCRILINIDLDSCCRLCQNGGSEPESFEMAGPRRKIYFDPVKVKAAILTAGGLCPGLNDVVRSLVLTLHYLYGVKNIFGVRHGYQGLIPRFNLDMIKLDPAFVSEIHQFGGSVLSSSRGLYSIEEIVDFPGKAQYQHAFPHRRGRDPSGRPSDRRGDQETRTENSRGRRAQNH